MFFDQVAKAQPDSVFGLVEKLNTDPRPDKVDLIVGIYKDENLESKLFPSVRDAKHKIFEEDLFADYLPIDGLPNLSELLGQLLFGSERWKSRQSCISCVQALGGTSAIQLGAQFLIQELTNQVYISDPTWVNHKQIFASTGFQIATYPYYDRNRKNFSFESMCEKIETAPENSIFVLHACCHNPTGKDPRLEEWKKISQLFKKKNLFPFFDCAYQGFGRGLDEDVEAVRLFLDEGHEMAVAYSCSKNFSLYCQRVGALFLVCQNSQTKLKVSSQIKRIIRTIYSNPPAHGARLVSKILSDIRLRTAWAQDLYVARSRIVKIQQELIKKLKSKMPNHNFDYLEGHTGMFMLIDFTPDQVQQLREKFGVYLLETGRINVVGLSEKNIDFVVDSFSKVMHS